MTDQYDPRKDPIAPKWEKSYFDFFETCMINGRYQDGMRVFKLEGNTLPQYIIDRFKPEFEKKIEEGRKARKNLGRKVR